MRNLLWALFLGGLFLQVNPFKCPEGSISMPSEDVCIYAIDNADFYIDAARYCVKLGGLAVKIQNTFENTYVFATIGQQFNGVAPYIGVERKKNNTWTYADGSPLTYQNWALNEPNMSSNTSACAIMNPQTGQWISSECFFSRPFFCSVNGDDFQCPKGWVYSETFDYCYYLQNFSYPGYWELYNWTTAEANCQLMGSHLVSIHSKPEDDFVRELITSNVKNLSNVAPDNNTCVYQWAWIGYYGNGTLGTGTWTDGTQVDYNAYGSTGGPSFWWWMMSNDQSCNFKRWSWADQSFPFARFICKMPSKSRIAREKTTRMDTK